MQHRTYWRGAKTSEIGKGDFNGVWLSTQKQVAAQYGQLHQYKLQPSTTLLNRDQPISRKLEQSFIKEYPDLDELVNQDGEFTELWMFPPDEWIKFLRRKGYDGYVNASDTFVFNTNKIAPIQSPTSTKESSKSSPIRKPTPTDQSSRSLAIDRALLAKQVVTVDDPRWLKHPNRFDVRGIDTPGSNRIIPGVAYADKGARRLSRKKHRGFKKIKF